LFSSPSKNFSWSGNWFLSTIFIFPGIC
jgi:hypothetical protein